jgi:putative PIG3 family NAD(P)H quinone oxidoreductase
VRTVEPHVEAAEQLVRAGALGEGVTRWQPGDEVCALLTGGGYAQKVAVPEGQLLTVPKGVSLVQAAALPEATATVWSNVFMTGGLKPGETFLMHGGAGGIGTTAIQIAKAHGARVVTTVGGPEQAARVRELGADLAINYRTEDFAEHGPYDVILDVIGGDYLPRNIHSLALDGRLVVIGLQNGLTAELNLVELLARRASVHGTTLRSRQAGQRAAIVAEVQEHVWPLIENGTVQVVIDRTLPMDQTAEAHRILDAHHIGKIVLLNPDAA